MCSYILTKARFYPLILVLFAEQRWSGLKNTSDERRQSLEGVVSDLQDFKDSYAQIQGWLAQKEKMVVVLGPLATEPAMVNNQLQQVQVGISTA